MTLQAGEREFQLDAPACPLDATWLVPEAPSAVIVLAHGAGAGQRHTNMAAIAQAFLAVGLATLRFNFPYMQQGKRRVNTQAVSVETIAAAHAHAVAASDLPVFLAGHSYGGRMATHAVAERGLACAGIVLCSFPLHPAKKPAVERAAHLSAVARPMLFLSGTRDDLADAALLTSVVNGLGDARLHWLDTANHSYAVLKRTRDNPLSVFDEMARATADFVAEVS